MDKHNEWLKQLDQDTVQAAVTAIFNQTNDSNINSQEPIRLFANQIYFKKFGTNFRIPWRTQDYKEYYQECKKVSKTTLDQLYKNVEQIYADKQTTENFMDQIIKNVEQKIYAGQIDREIFGDIDFSDEYSNTAYLNVTEKPVDIIDDVDPHEYHQYDNVFTIPNYPNEYHADTNMYDDQHNDTKPSELHDALTPNYENTENTYTYDIDYHSKMMKHIGSLNKCAFKKCGKLIGTKEATTCGHMHLNCLTPDQYYCNFESCGAIPGTTFKINQEIRYTKTGTEFSNCKGKIIGTTSQRPRFCQCDGNHIEVQFKQTKQEQIYCISSVD